MTTGSMVRRLTPGSLLLTSALTFVLVFAPVATCLAASAQSPEPAHHPCCAGMTQGCGSVRTPQSDCCAVPNADVVRRTSDARAAAISVSAVVSTAAWLTTHAATPPVAAREHGTPTASSPPTYLLVSVFRI